MLRPFAHSVACFCVSLAVVAQTLKPVPNVDVITGLCKNNFDTIIEDPEHRLNSLIPFNGPSRYALRCNRRFIVPNFKTYRFRN